MTGKDITESYVDRHPIYDLFVNLHKHANLEDVVKEGHRFSAFQVSFEELTWLPADEYGEPSCGARDTPRLGEGY